MAVLFVLVTLLFMYIKRKWVDRKARGIRVLFTKVVQTRKYKCNNAYISFRTIRRHEVEWIKKVFILAKYST